MNSLAELKLLTKLKVKAMRYHSRHKAAVAMLHFGRCGSTVLADLLSQRKDIQWDGELFERYRTGELEELSFTNDAMRILKLRMRASHTPIYGFECKSFPEEHLRPTIANASIEKHIEALDRLGFSHFIFLRRRNYLHRIVSATIALESHIWHIKSSDHISGMPKPCRVRLDPDRVHFGETYVPLLESFSMYDAYDEQIVQSMATRKALYLSYEDDIESNPEKAYHKVCEFLRVEPHRTKVRLKKTNPADLHDKLHNLKEIEQLLSGTKYSWMLNQ